MSRANLFRSKHTRSWVSVVLVILLASSSFAFHTPSDGSAAVEQRISASPASSTDKPSSIPAVSVQQSAASPSQQASSISVVADNARGSASTPLFIQVQHNLGSAIGLFEDRHLASLVLNKGVLQESKLYPWKLEMTKEKLNVLVELSTSNALYTIRARIKPPADANADAEGNDWVYSSVPACSYLGSSMADVITLVLDSMGRLQGVDFSTLPAETPTSSLASHSPTASDSLSNACVERALKAASLASFAKTPNAVLRVSLPRLGEHLRLPAGAASGVFRAGVISSSAAANAAASSSAAAAAASSPSSTTPTGASGSGQVEGAKEEEKSLLARYWHLLLPAVIVVLMTGGSDQQQGQVQGQGQGQGQGGEGAGRGARTAGGSSAGAGAGGKRG